MDTGREDSSAPLSRLIGCNGLFSMLHSMSVLCRQTYWLTKQWYLSLAIAETRWSVDERIEEQMATEKRAGAWQR